MLLRRFAREEAGYTLVELLVAILLLSIAIIPMVGMFDAALRAANTSSSYDEARSLANGKLEELRSLPFENDTVADDTLVELPPKRVSSWSRMETSRWWGTGHRFTVRSSCGAAKETESTTRQARRAEITLKTPVPVPAERRGRYR